MKNYSSQLTRAIRKYYEIKHIDFAPIIESSQSALSKVESEILGLDAMQWVTICEKFNLDPRSLITGKIENLGTRKMQVDDISRIGGFKIPERYAHHMGSTARTAYPLIKFMITKLGEKKASAFFKSINMDKDYFVIMNNPINLLFIQDLYDFLTSQGALTPQTVPQIIKTAQFKDVHSFILPEISQTTSVEQATKKLLQRIKTNYELNTQYAFGGGKDFIEATDQAHVKELKLKSDFQKFRQVYNLSHIQALDTDLMEDSSTFKVRPTEKGWIIVEAS